MEKVIEKNEGKIKQEQLREIKRYKEDLAIAEEENRDLIRRRKPHLGLLVTVMLFLGGAIGLGVGYGISFVIPDKELRSNAINSKNEESLLYFGDAKPEGITSDLQRGYTKSEIEDNYVLKPSKTDLPGLNTDAGEDNDLISKQLLNNNYVYSGAANQQPGSLSLPLVTEAYFSKARFENDKLYETTGTGNSKTFADVSSQYIKKPDTGFVLTGLYKTSGTNDATLLGNDVSSQYIKKPDTGFVLTGLYKTSGTNDETLLGKDVTNDYIEKSTLTNNGLYLFTKPVTGTEPGTLSDNLAPAPLVNNGLYKAEVSSAGVSLSGDVSNDYVLKNELFYVNSSEKFTGTNEILLDSVSTDNGGLHLVKKYYRIYDSRDSSVHSTVFTRIPLGQEKEFYIVAPLVPNINTDISSTLTPGTAQFVALLTMRVTNNNGVLSATFGQNAYFLPVNGGAFPSGSTKDNMDQTTFPTFTPQQILDRNREIPLRGSTTVSQEALDTFFTKY